MKHRTQHTQDRARHEPGRSIAWDDLAELLHGLEGRPYPAYRDLRDLVVTDGEGSLELSFPHIQGDPFASPSTLRILIPAEKAELPDWATASKPRSLGTATFLARRAAHACEQHSGRSGSGKSGLISIDRPGQQVLHQTALQVTPDGTIDLRLRVGLPGRGRRIAGHAAADLLGTSLIAITNEILFRPDLATDLKLAAETNEDAEALRAQLPDLGLVAFLADGSHLARATGIDDSPMSGDGSVPLQSPPSLRRTITLPNVGDVVGMGIPEGVTLIVGGGFHGKSTLLAAIGAGVYNHIPGDGRERIATRDDAMRIRAEDGRPVSAVDISPFIQDLPGGIRTRSFSTPNASGSTSQAAATVEAIEAESRFLLIDEDTAATNFMVRDQRMQRLVSPDREPIIPFVARIRQLYADLGVSTLLVVGGTGDYFDQADTVIGMDEFQASDRTADARAIAEADPRPAPCQDLLPVGDPASSSRCPQAASIGATVAASRGRDRAPRVRVRDRYKLQIGDEEIDLSGAPQIIHTSQTRAIGEALLLLFKQGHLDGTTAIPKLLDLTEEALQRSGPDALDTRLHADLAAFRRQDLAAALNRLRSLRISGPSGDTLPA